MFKLVSHKTSRFCSLVNACRFALRVVYEKFASITRMFQMSENTELRLLLLLNSNANFAKNVQELLTVQCLWEDFRHVLSNEWRSCSNFIPEETLVKSCIS